MKLIIAASGTGGHIFPALAVAEELKDYEIEWLGVANRLEQTLISDRYPLHILPIKGLQKPLGLNIIPLTQGFISSILQVQKLIKQNNIKAIFTTGGYIAAPAIVAGRLQKIPVIIHESNFIPGKVTRLLSSWCHTVALGFADTAKYLPRSETMWVSTPVRSQFLTSQSLDLPIPADVPLIVVIGGSQGAVAVNQLVRQCVKAWITAGAYIVHLTGNNDPEANSLEYPHYFPYPFYDNMAGLLQRANLAISRAGAGSLTELAITHTPAILIPYPYAAENHQTYNAEVFVKAGAADVYSQSELTGEMLQNRVLELLCAPEQLGKMANNSGTLAMADSGERLANLIREIVG